MESDSSESCRVAFKTRTINVETSRSPVTSLPGKEGKIALIQAYRDADNFVPSVKTLAAISKQAPHSHRRRRKMSSPSRASTSAHPVKSPVRFLSCAPIRRHGSSASSNQI